MYPWWRGGQQQPRQGHALLGTQDNAPGGLSSLLAASRELCGAVVTQKLGRMTEHAQPQASECRLDGAIPRSEVESIIRPNTGSPHHAGYFSGAERTGLSARASHGLHGVQYVALAQLSSKQAPGLQV